MKLYRVDVERSSLDSFFVRAETEEDARRDAEELASDYVSDLPLYTQIDVWEDDRSGGWWPDIPVWSGGSDGRWEDAPQ